MFKRPSPALVVAALALFLALVGTGFAANSAHVSALKKKKPPAALTAKKVNQLIAAYIRHHHVRGPRGLRGATGAAGAAGSPGQVGGTGPAGPGAKQIVVFNSGQRTRLDLATVGPWTVSLECTQSADINITGPGSYFATTVTGTPAASANTVPPNARAAVNNQTLGAGGFSTGTDQITAGAPRQQESVDVHLISGSTVWELHLQLGAETVSGQPTGTCNVVGSAIPVT